MSLICLVNSGNPKALYAVRTVCSLSSYHANLQHNVTHTSSVNNVCILDSYLKHCSNMCDAKNDIHVLLEVYRVEGNCLVKDKALEISLSYVPGRGGKKANVFGATIGQLTGRASSEHDMQLRDMCFWPSRKIAENEVVWSGCDFYTPFTDTPAFRDALTDDMITLYCWPSSFRGAEEGKGITLPCQCSWRERTPSPPPGSLDITITRIYVNTMYDKFESEEEVKQRCHHHLLDFYGDQRLEEIERIHNMMEELVDQGYIKPRQIEHGNAKPRKIKGVQNQALGASSKRAVAVRLAPALGQIIHPSIHPLERRTMGMPAGFSLR